MSKKVLNLLVIDEEQLYAEQLVEWLSQYYDDVNLGFLDAKDELIKTLRNTWDVLVYHKAYDMSFTDVVALTQEHTSGLPIVQLVSCEDDAQKSSVLDLPEHIDGELIKTLSIGQDSHIVLAICLQAEYAKLSRHVAHLQSILKEAEQRANILIKNSKSAVAYIDQGVHIFANDPYLQMFGYSSMDEIIGVPVVDIISGGDNIKGFKQFLRRFDKGDRKQVEFAFESRKTDGTTFASKLQLASATLQGEPVVQMIIQHNDANAAELAKKMAALERHDALTGLSNRLGFMEHLEQAHKDTDSGINAALLYVSVDDIGKISSNTGMTGVDAAIKYMANLLSEEFEDGQVSRFSDSAFMVILSEVSAEKVQQMAEKTRVRAENSLIEVAGRTLTSTLSIGVVMMDINAAKPQVLIDRAIELVGKIQSETEQGNAVRVFDISEEASGDEDALAEYIQDALAKNRFVLKYQPAYDTETDSSDLFEVYVTLPMPEGQEALTLEKFIHIAKKQNLADKLDRWVLINACKHVAEVRKTHPNARILVALSAQSLVDTNLADIATKLTRAVGGQAPLILQFDEHDAVDYLAQAKRQFMALNEIGCPVGIKNFGATAKTADMLEHLSPKIVRLARSYTKDLTRTDNLSTIKTLVKHAHDKQAAALMPYIEDASMMSAAWSVGARFLQGDYLQAAAEQMMYVQTDEE